MSNWIQRAGRAARGRGRTGIAILLVEKSAYNTDLVNQAAPSNLGKSARNKKGKTTANPASTSKADPKQVREYAQAHGVSRGGTQKLDAVPAGPQPILNPEAADEGLLTFVQSVECRRRVWAKAFESPLPGEYSCYSLTRLTPNALIPQNPRSAAVTSATPLCSTVLGLVPLHRTRAPRTSRKASRTFVLRVHCESGETSSLRATISMHTTTRPLFSMMISSPPLSAPAASRQHNSAQCSLTSGFSSIDTVKSL